MVALRNDLGALLAEHQAEDEDGRAVGHRRNGVDEKGEDARQAEDEVDEAWLGLRLGFTSGVGWSWGQCKTWGQGQCKTWGQGQG